MIYSDEIDELTERQLFFRYAPLFTGDAEINMVGSMQQYSGLVRLLTGLPLPMNCPDDTLLGTVAVYLHFEQKSMFTNLSLFLKRASDA